MRAKAKAKANGNGKVEWQGSKRSSHDASKVTVTRKRTGARLGTPPRPPRPRVHDDDRKNHARPQPRVHEDDRTNHGKKGDPCDGQSNPVTAWDSRVVCLFASLRVVCRASSSHMRCSVEPLLASSQTHSDSSAVLLCKERGSTKRVISHCLKELVVGCLSVAIEVHRFDKTFNLLIRKLLLRLC